MSSKNDEKSGYDLDMNLLAISSRANHVCVSYP